jgi:hypothetical protein
MFLQLHHIMEEVIGGVPLDEPSIMACIKMISTLLSTPYVLFFPADSLNTKEMHDVEVAEGMPYESWKEVRELSATRLQIWTEKYYPISHRDYGKATAVLEDVQEQVSVRDTKHILSPRLEVGGKTKGNRAWIHFQASQKACQTDTEVRVLMHFEDPPLVVPVQPDGSKYVAEPRRLIYFAKSILTNNKFHNDIHANVIVLLAEQAHAQLYTDFVELFMQVALRSDWLNRLTCHEILHNVLYPGRQLLPLLYQASVSPATPIETRYQLVEICRRIAHPSFTDDEGFNEFLETVRTSSLRLISDGLWEQSKRMPPAGMRLVHQAGIVSRILSAIHPVVPMEVQVSLIGLGSVVCSRDLDCCEQALLENSYNDGVEVQGGAKFCLWSTFADLLMSRKPEVQAVVVRMLNTLFWRKPQETVELTTTNSGQCAETYWMLPRLLGALGHESDEVVKDILEILQPLVSAVQVVKDEDVEPEF